MFGSDTVLTLIQDRLLDELSDNLKYRVQAEILERGGYKCLAEGVEEIANIERNHADRHIQRLSYYSAVPTAKLIPTIVTSTDLPTMIQSDLEDEKKGLAEYADAFTSAMNEGDVMTAMMFQEIMRDEEGHIAFFERELGRVSSIDPSAYLLMNANNSPTQAVPTSEDSDSIKYPPEIAEDPSYANAKWLVDNNPRKEIYATGIDANQHPMTAYLVDGDAIRTNVWQDWVDGGNHARYPWIPEGEFWLDEANEEEYMDNLIHETRECQAMNGGMSYDEAHSKYANVDEYMARHGEKVMAIALIRAMGWGLTEVPADEQD